MFLKKGTLHGYFLSISRASRTFGLYLNGQLAKPTWKRLEGQGYMFNNEAFFYPDLETVLVGSFDSHDTVIEAQEATLKSVKVNPFGILEPSFGLFKKEKAFISEVEVIKDTICNWPLRPDPYEVKHVEVKKSSIPGAGQGLFAIKAIEKGQLVAFFNGVPMENEGSDYSIKYDDWLMLDIPESCRSTKAYCATLAHKICHSFEPNSQYAYAFHPRFGKRIRCAIAVKFIEVGEEITCNYKYKFDKSPDWYKDCLKTYLDTKQSIKIH